MISDKDLLKYNVELFTISLYVNRAKEGGLDSVCIDSPLFKISYDALNTIAEHLVYSKEYKTVETNFFDRRNANHPTGIYSDKSLSLQWWED